MHVGREEGEREREFKTFLKASELDNLLVWAEGAFQAQGISCMKESMAR